MSAIMTAIYGGGPFYSGGQPVMDDLKSSGFTTVIAWSVHVSATGDLIYNDPTIVSNGAYVGDSSWPAQLASLKQGSTSVDRLLFSVGSGGVQDFHHIQALIQQQGTGPNSILYKNFAALKAAIPTIDGIDLDDEDLFDQNTIVQFSNMLHDIGFQVTFCPYFGPSFWVDCLYALNTPTPGLVTGFNLQCYSGGAGNNPQSWINAIAAKMGPGFDAKGFVFPGLWCRNGTACLDGDCPEGITSQFASWRPTGIQGGFIWLYDDIQKCVNSNTCTGPMNTTAYASAIVAGLQPSLVRAEVKVEK